MLSAISPSSDLMSSRRAPVFGRPRSSSLPFCTKGKIRPSSSPPARSSSNKSRGSASSVRPSTLRSTATSGVIAGRPEASSDQGQNMPPHPLSAGRTANARTVSAALSGMGRSKASVSAKHRSWQLVSGLAFAQANRQNPACRSPHYPWIPRKMASYRCRICLSAALTCIGIRLGERVPPCSELDRIPV